MTIQIGDTLPDITLKTNGADCSDQVFFALKF